MTTSQEHYEVAEELHHALIENNLVLSCLNCEHFTEDSATCTKWGTRPPAQVIVYSCGSAHWFPKLPF